MVWPAQSILATARSFYRQSLQEASWLRAGCYPDFVTARQPEVLDRDVPVFVCHSIDPVEFQAQLGFLAENGHGTLSPWQGTRESRAGSYKRAEQRRRREEDVSVYGKQRRLLQILWRRLIR